MAIVNHKTIVTPALGPNIQLGPGTGPRNRDFYPGSKKQKTPPSTAIFIRIFISSQYYRKTFKTNFNPQH
jgi:hypothetical protein